MRLKCDPFSGPTADADSSDKKEADEEVSKGTSHVLWLVTENGGDIGVCLAEYVDEPPQPLATDDKGNTWGAFHVGNENGGGRATCATLKALAQVRRTAHLPSLENQNLVAVPDGSKEVNPQQLKVSFFGSREVHMDKPSCNAIQRAASSRTAQHRR